MRMLEQKRTFIGLALATLLCTVAVPRHSFADDKNDNNPPAKTAPVKIDAPAPGLTERERWLLDRVEQLEKRVDELESKGNSPASANTAATPSAESATSVAPVPATSVDNSSIVPHDHAVPASAALQDKPLSSKTPKAEPLPSPISPG